MANAALVAPRVRRGWKAVLRGIRALRARLRRFWTFVGRRADQVMASGTGFASFSRFLMLCLRIGAGRHCCGPRRPGRQVPEGQAQLLPYLTDDASCGLANGNIVESFGQWQGVLWSIRSYWALRLRPHPAGDKAVGQALSSQNVSNRTTS